MLGIIAAMRVEAMELIEKMTDRVENTISGITFTNGKLCGHDAVVAVCGIGKVFAALCTQTMILTYHPDAIVNTGVGGTLTDALSICDICARGSGRTDFRNQRDLPSGRQASY